jgi:hypothetical protein
MNKELFGEIIKANHQFKLDSDLWKAIQYVTGWTVAESQESAKFHCNSLSFYALCRAHGWIMFPYAIWIQKLSEADFFNIKSGWVSASKLRIADLFGFSDRFNDLVYVYNYENLMSGKNIDKDKGIQIKVFSNHNTMNLTGKGDHFMGGYYIGNELFLDDSGNRGYKVKARDVIPKSKFQWGLII